MTTNQANNTPIYYTKTARVLHWVMAILFLAVWLAGFYSGNFLSYDSNADLKSMVIDFHKNFATVIIFLFVVRVLWRYTHPAPALPATMSPLMKRAAHLGHLLLYLLLLFIPITGMIFSWSAGYPAPVLYLFNIPTLLSENPELLAIIKPVHTYLAWFAGIVIVGHAAAAFKHHFFDKDNVLRSMTGPD